MKKYFSLLSLITCLSAFTGPPATALHAAEPRKVEAKGVDLNYLRAGSGNSVVMIHGSYSSLYAFSMSIFNDVSQEFDTTAIDLPGFGASKRPHRKISLEEKVEIVHDGVQKLGIQNPVFVGHSMGAAFSLAYAVKYPHEVKALVLLSPYIQPFKKADLVYRIASKPLLGDLFVYSFIKPMVWLKPDASFLKTGFYPDLPDKNYAQKEVPLATRRKTFRNNAWDTIQYGLALEDLGQHYQEIKAPVFILAGDSDRVAPPEANAVPLHEKIPGSRLVILPKTGHLPAFTKKQEVVEIVREAAKS